jgi:uncharacterized protein YlxW (UPF0749 family)
MMEGGQLMVVMIVAIVMIASIIKARHRHERSCGTEEGGGRTQVENQRLRDEVVELKERIKVLERITIEKENSLSREIESLRDR